MDLGFATITASVITVAGTTLTVLVQRLRRENAEQHAEGRELIREIGLDVRDVKADVREVKDDVRDVRGRVSKLEARDS